MQGEAMVMMLPCIVKSHMDGDKRIVEVGASTEEIDYDGDVILQQALLGDATNFVTKGHLDIDHKSEFGERLGIPNPASYIVGRPIEVKDIGSNHTAVVGQIAKAKDGSFNPKLNKADEFWASMQQDPPVQWYSSVYGFPTDMEVVAKAGSNPYGARRYVIKAMSWRSLAFTRTPKNTAIKNAARIVTAKSFMFAVSKGMDPYADMPPMTVNSMNDLWERRFCAKCAVQKSATTEGYRHHFEKCLGVMPGDADIYAHAVMQHHMQRHILGLE